MKEKYEINGGALARTWAPAKLTVPWLEHRRNKMAHFDLKDSNISICIYCHLSPQYVTVCKVQKFHNKFTFFL